MSAPSLVPRLEANLASARADVARARVEAARLLRAYVATPPTSVGFELRERYYRALERLDEAARRLADARAEAHVARVHIVDPAVYR